MTVVICRICGTEKELTGTTYFCLGPSDLCDYHYGQWSVVYNRTGSYDKAVAALTNVVGDPR